MNSDGPDLIELNARPTSVMYELKVDTESMKLSWINTAVFLFSVVIEVKLDFPSILMKLVYDPSLSIKSLIICNPIALMNVVMDTASTVAV